MEKRLGSFEAQRVYTLSGGGVFRLYVTDQRIVSIRISTPLEEASSAAWAHFGLVGVLIARYAQKRAARKRETVANEMEQLSLDELIIRNPKSFETRFDQLKDIELKKAWFASKGRLKLIPEVGKPIHFLFSQIAHRDSARDVLQAALGDRLKLDPKLKRNGLDGQLR